MKIYLLLKKYLSKKFWTTLLMSFDTLNFKIKIENKLIIIKLLIVASKYGF